MEKEAAVQEMQEEAVKERTYVPRNGIVAAKESIYDKMNISVKQVDLFIGGCCALILLFILIGISGMI